MELASGNTVRGLDIAATNGRAVFGNGIAGATFDRVSTTGAGGGTGVRFDNATGTFTMSDLDAWSLVRVQGDKNTKEAAYHCNSRSYRSGGSYELPEGYDDPHAAPPSVTTYNGRDGEIDP